MTHSSIFFVTRKTCIKPHLSKDSWTTPNLQASLSAQLHAAGASSTNPLVFSTSGAESFQRRQPVVDLDGLSPGLTLLKITLWQRIFLFVSKIWGRFPTKISHHHVVVVQFFWGVSRMKKLRKVRFWTWWLFLVQARAGWGTAVQFLVGFGVYGCSETAHLAMVLELQQRPFRIFFL